MQAFLSVHPLALLESFNEYDGPCSEAYRFAVPFKKTRAFMLLTEKFDPSSIS